MSTTEAKTKAYSVEQLAKLDDDELSVFMNEHRSPDGAFHLPVDDWDKLSARERNNLAERLM